MPNWVRNKVWFTGTEKDVKALREFVTSEECEFDFNKIVPIPACAEDVLSWCQTKWSTKWNAQNVVWEGDEFVSFDTAWSYPEEIFFELAERFPAVKIYVQFADEFIGQNCGEAGFNDEKVGSNWMELEDMEEVYADY